MNSLDKAVELVSRWQASREKDRVAVVERLNDLIKECQAATKVWQAYADAPGAQGDGRTILSWVGPERAKQLHEISLRAKNHVERICQAAGPEVSRFAGYDDDVIENAYRQLQPGENGIDAGKTALSHMQQRGNSIRELIGRLSVNKPATKAAMKKSVGTRSAPKKTAKKKSATAKPAKKKAPRPK